VLLPLRACRGVLPALILISLAVSWRALAAVYPPAAGPIARRQAVRDLECSAVVMTVAAEPGEEDLPSLAALRMGAGARVVAVFVTDGGATPSDADGALPMHVAARRRYEADAAVRALGGEPYFMGFPDYGFVSGREALERLWSRDSLIARLVGAIRTYRPDVILIGHDARENAGDTIRPALIREIVLAAVKSAAAAPRAPGASSVSWSVARVCEEHVPGTLTIPVDRVDPLLKKSYRAFAAQSARVYRTLRLSVAGRVAERTGSYRTLRGDDGDRGDVIDGLPAVPAALKAAEAGVRQAAQAAGGGPDGPALRSIGEAIAGVEHAIEAGKGRLTNIEKRLLIGWKEGLEALRCVVLGVDVRYAVSDTVVARRQQYTLRFPADSRFPSSGTTEIIFPAAMDTTWLINGTERFRFAFTLPDTFNLITPGDMPWNRPVSSIGSRSTALNAYVPFIIAHKEADPLRRFALRREMVLGVSPNQSVEFLTPFVRMTPGERLVVRLQNVSRDVYRGTMSVGDSVVRPAGMRIALRRSDGPVDDTLALAWRDSVSAGDHVIALRIGKGPPVGTFVARRFAAAADTSRPVGLFTGLRDSPLGSALRRLHVSALPIGGVFDDSTLGRFRTIIVDRAAVELRTDGARVSAAIEGWVRRGGRCIVLAQDWSGKGGGPLARLVKFGPARLFAPEAPVLADISAGVTTTPNALTPADWEGWIISRARTTVDITEHGGAVVWCRDAASGLCLGATFAEGRGSITAVALDILPQLQIVHPGACRLLANLVSY